MPSLSGRAFNIGGGPANTVSVLELIARLESSLSRRIPLLQGPWRMGDQRYYVSDTSRFAAATGWSPRVSVADGIANLCEWLRASAQLAFRPPQPVQSRQPFVSPMMLPGARE
jgi:CDP-paratose 2-epimerase